MYGLLFLQLFTSLGCSPTDFLFEKRIRIVSMDLIYIIFTYYTQDNKQECIKLSNWFSLRCLGPWMNHLPPVWWSNFRLVFLNQSWCASLTYWWGIFYWCLVYITVFIHWPNANFIIHLIWFHSEIAFCIQGTIICHRRSLYSFLWFECQTWPTRKAILLTHLLLSPTIGVHIFPASTSVTTCPL